LGLIISANGLGNRPLWHTFLRHATKKAVALQLPDQLSQFYLARRLFQKNRTKAAARIPPTSITLLGEYQGPGKLDNNNKK
jgi:hypothetical protein